MKLDLRSLPNGTEIYVQNGDWYGRIDTNKDGKKVVKVYDVPCGVQEHIFSNIETTITEHELNDDNSNLLDIEIVGGCDEK